MFALQRENYVFFRVKYGQTAREIERELKIPVQKEIFCGQILRADLKCREHTVKVGETYRSVGEREGVDGEKLEKFNFCEPLYPAKKIYIPL